MRPVKDLSPDSVYTLPDYEYVIQSQYTAQNKHVQIIIDHRWLMYGYLH